MPDVKAIAAQLEPLCRAIEGTMYPGRDAAVIESWTRYNALRHAVTIRAILDWARRNGRRELTLLNAGGMSCGGQDFSLGEVLPGALERVELSAVEHPDSEHLRHPGFQERVRRYGIEVLRRDVAAEGYPEGRSYDVVLFTEIAEHLEHSALLRALTDLRRLTAPGGLLILSTPNMASAMNRLRLLIRGELPYWGDDHAWLERYEWGHLAMYTPARMARLAESCGWRVVERSTFSCGVGGPPQPLWRRLPRAVISRTVGRLPAAGDTLLLQLTPAEPPGPAAPSGGR